MNSSSSSQPYQGYPYVNPFVVDAHSIDQATAARWTELPRRPIHQHIHKAKHNPVVYINMPEEGAGQMNNTQTSQKVQNRPALPPKRDDTAPTIYIDLPDQRNTVIQNDYTSDSEYEDEQAEDRHQNALKSALPAKKNPDVAPVVYIDMPEQSGSGVTQSREEPQEDNEPAFVQETIFYDPFKNRRIDVAKEEDILRIHGRMEPDSDEDSVSTRCGASNLRRPARPAPQRPDILHLHSPGSSASSMLQTSPSPSTSTPVLPPTMSKEALIYGRQTSQDDGFPLSPIQVSEFPEPPPAYTEFDRVTSPQPSIVEQPVRQPVVIPPRTQVILPRETISTPIGMPNPHRKNLNCHYCGMMVHTLVIKENGISTHILATICFIFGMLPIVCIIYCTDYFKVKNHYCPNCSKIIGHEFPLGRGRIYFTN